MDTQQTPRHDYVSDLYDALIESGKYDASELAGNKDNFRNAMSSKETRKAMYDWIAGNEDFDIGPYDTYEVDLASSYDTEAEDLKALAAQVKPTTTPEPQKPKTIAEQYDRESVGEQLWQPFAKTNEEAEYTPSPVINAEEADKVGAPLSAMDKAVYTANTQALLDNLKAGNKATEKRLAGIGDQSPTLTEEVVQGEDGPMTIYHTPDGRTFNNKVEATLSMEDTARAIETKSVEGLEQRLARLEDATNERREVAAKEWQDDFAKKHEAAKKGSFWDEVAFAMVNTTPQSYASGAMANVQGDPEYRAYNAAKVMTEGTINMIREAEKSMADGRGLGAWTKAVGRGFGDNFTDPRTWDLGVGDLLDSTAVLMAAKAFDEAKGDMSKLTPAQRELLNAVAVDTAYRAMYEDAISSGYTAGSVTAEALPFIAQMMLGGSSSIAQLVTKGAYKGALKAVKGGIKNKALRYTTKALTKGIGNLGSAALMTGTFGTGTSLADANRRMTGNATPIISESGEIVYGGREGAEDVGTALRKAYTNTFIEYYSEMLGGSMGDAVDALADVTGVTSLMKKAFKNLPKKAAPITELIKAGQWHGLFGEYAEEVAGGALNAALVGDVTTDDLLSMDYHKETLEGLLPMSIAFGILGSTSYRTQGYIARKNLRAAQNALRAQGINSIDDLHLTTENTLSQIEEVANNDNFSIAQKQAIISYLKAEQAVLETEKGQQAAEELMSEENITLGRDLEKDFNIGISAWNSTLEGNNEQAEQVKSEYEEARAQFDEKQLAEMDKLTNNELFEYLNNHKKQARTIWDYLRKRQRYIAIDMAEKDVARAEEKIGAEIEMGRAQGAAITPEEIDTKGTEAIAALDEIGAQLTTKERNDLENEGISATRKAANPQAAEDYLSAKAYVEGMYEGAKAQADAVAQKAAEEVQSRTHADDGQIYTATTNGGESVNVVRGKVALNADGTIDLGASDKGITVVDEAGNKKMISSRELKSLEVANGAEAQQVASEAAKQTYLQKLEALFNAPTPTQLEQQAAELEEEQVQMDAANRAVQQAEITNGSNVAIEVNGAQYPGQVMIVEDGGAVVDFGRPIIYNGRRSRTHQIPVGDLTNLDAIAREVESQTSAEQPQAQSTPEAQSSASLAEQPAQEEVDYDALLERDPAEFLDKYDAEVGTEVAQGFMKGLIEDTRKAVKAKQAAMKKAVKSPNQYVALKREADALQGRLELLEEVYDKKYNAPQEAIEETTSPEVAKENKKYKNFAEEINALFPDGMPSIYAKVLADVATGIRFVWESKGNRRGLDSLFKQDSKNSYINIIASADKGGVYLDDYIHSIWQNPQDVWGNRSGYEADIDDATVRNDVEEALMTVNSRKSAMEELRNIQPTQDPYFDMSEEELLDYMRSKEAEQEAVTAPNTNLTDGEIETLMQTMMANAEVERVVELTPENWEAEFGESGIVQTPIGEVKMGENQFLKLMQRKRQRYFGMIRPTLSNPDIILEEHDPNDNAERDTKLLFVKTFIKEDGSRYIHFESVTVLKEGREVAISSHEVNPNDLRKKMHNDNIVHLNDTLLDSEGHLTKPQDEGSDLVPTPSVISDNKDNTPNAENQISEQENVSPIENKIAEWSKKLGVPVSVYRSVDEIPNAQARAAINAGQAVRGWYEPSTGAVAFYAPNLNSEAEVDEVFAHEVVAHKGLRGLLGQEKFDALCDKVWDMMSEADRESYMNYPGVNGDKRAAADEYMAHLAEKVDLTNEERTIWQSIVDFVKKVLLDMKATLSDKNIEDLIRMSYRETAKKTSIEKKTLASKTKKTRKREVSSTKIEDYGEKIAGARKDILKNISKNFDNATIESLIALPFAKAFVKPDLKKLVEAGVLRPNDAKYAEAIMWVYINKNKPKARKTDAYLAKRGRENRITEWAKKTYEGITRLRDFIEADEAKRDELISQYGTLGEQIKAEEVEYRNSKNGQFNAAANGYGDLYSPNPIEIIVAALDKLNYQAGDKVVFDAPIVKAEYLGRYFNFENQDGEKVYAFNRVDNIEDAINTLVLQAKIRRGDTDIQYPLYMFSITHEDPIREPSGMFTVFHFNRRGMVISETVDSKEIAEKKVADYKASGNDAQYREERKIVGYSTYRIRFKNRLTDVETIFDEKFGSEAEARQAFENRYDEFNDMANDYVASLSNKKREEVLPFEVAPSWTSETRTVKYIVKNTDTGDVMSPRFDTRKEAEEYFKKHIDEWGAKWREMKEARKKFVYFDDNVSPRKGTDYRQGRDVTPEDLASTFGFRGIQFGNWTNDADRQAALNQAYDAFMDLADIIGVSPKAISLAGELGIAFGARGGGSANAHYEPTEVVINLTKTRGAGSLAHEWWHALDNYFSRQGDVAMGFVTTNPTEAKMREEMRMAWQGVVNSIKGTDYAKRSMAQGDYWGRMLEMTARLFAEWTVYELAKTGRTNHFLSRGVTPQTFDMMRRINYSAYKWSLPENEIPMSFEEFAKLPRSIKGMPFPTKEETEQMGDAVRNLFDIMEERIDEQGNAILFSVALTPEEQTIVDKAKADGTYLKAPNGKATNLSPKRWAQVRTEAFKKWFGDWEKAARIEKLRNSKSAEITGAEFQSSEDMKQYRQNALEYGKTLRGEVINADTGSAIVVNTDSVKEVLHHDGSDIAHIQSVAAIPQIIENGIYITTEPVSATASKRLRNAQEVHYYVCGLNIGETPYTVKFVVAEFESGEKYYDHSLTQIEKGDLLNRAEVSSTVAESKSPISDVKDKRLLSILQINSSKIIDENGEPKVVWHGGSFAIDEFMPNTPMHFGTKTAALQRILDTQWGFDNYDISQNENGKWSWKYTNPDDAGYDKQAEVEFDSREEAMADAVSSIDGAVVKPYFLNLRNPQQATDLDADWSGDIQSAKENGFDGLIYMNDVEDPGSTSYVAFESNQIKSVSENVGTFDAENNDIRFSIASMFPEQIEQGVASANSKQKIVGQRGEGIVDDIRFSIGRNRQEQMYNTLGKRRPDLTDQEKKAVIAELDKIDDNKVVNAAFHYFANGTIRIPEDLPKVEQAVKVASIAKVDPAAYRSPMELIDAHADIKIKDKRIDPDTVPTLSNKVDYGNGITVYDVEESQESRENMRKIINTHFGEESSPWCLLQGDGKGHLTPQSEVYWERYSAYPKRVAFKDGKLLAFFASDNKATWWDRQDNPYEGIPITENLRDGSGRVGTIEYYEDMREWGDYTDITLGVKGGNLYEEWESEDELLLREVKVGDMYYSYTFEDGEVIEYAEKDERLITRRLVKTNLDGDVNMVLDGKVRYEYDRGVVSRVTLNSGSSITRWRWDNKLAAVTTDRKRVDWIPSGTLNRVESYSDTGDVILNVDFDARGDMLNFSMLEDGERTFASWWGPGVLKQFREGGEAAFLDGDLVLDSTEGWDNLSAAQIREKAEAAKQRAEAKVVDMVQWAKDLANKQAEEAQQVYERATTFMENIDSSRPGEVRFSVATTPSEEQYSVKEAYDNRLSKRRTKLREEMLDDGIAIKILQDLIAKETGEPIADIANVYLHRNHMNSRSTQEIGYYEQKFGARIMEALRRLIKSGAKLKDIEKYLIAKHGLERNDYMNWREAVRKAAEQKRKKELKDYDNLVTTAKELGLPKPESKVKSVGEYEREYFAQYNEAIANLTNEEYTTRRREIMNSIVPYNFSEGRDQSGITETLGYDPEKEDAVEYDVLTEEAHRIVEQFESEYNAAMIAELWDSIKASAGFSLTKNRNTGQISNEYHDNASKMYRYYVPLRGWEKNKAEDVYAYEDVPNTGTTNRADLKAAGRRSKPDSPFATLANMAYTAIVQGNKNRANMSLLNLARMYPSDALSVHRIWEVLDEDTGDWVVAEPKLTTSNAPQGESSDEALNWAVENGGTVAADLAAYEEKMKALQKEGKARPVTGKIDSHLHFTNQQLKQHAVTVRVNGTPYIVWVNGNPRVAQTLNGLTRKQLEDWQRGVKAMTRWLSSVFTSKNPAFWVANGSRDLWYSEYRARTMFGMEYANRYTKNYGIVAAKIWELQRNGQLKAFEPSEDMGEIQQYYNEFIRNGGPVGYAYLKDVQELKGEMQTALKDMEKRVSFRRGWEKFDKNMDAISGTIETIPRLAAYITSRESGRSILDSISDAKEVTTNFDRKGGRFNQGFGVAWAFFNASVQGVQNFLNTVKEHPVKATMEIAGRAALGVYGVNILNMALAALFGDDPDEVMDQYFALPDYTRRHNLCFYIGGDWVKIPLPQTLRVFYGIGDIINKATHGYAHYDDIPSDIASLLGDFFPINLVGAENWVSAVFPTGLSPIAEVVTNTDYTGRPIANQTIFNKHLPEWQRTYGDESAPAVLISRALSKLSGGSKYKRGKIEFNPAYIDHLVKGYLGGVGTFITKGANTIEWGAKELAEKVSGGAYQNPEEFMWRGTPISSRLLQDAPTGDNNFRLNQAYSYWRDFYEKHNTQKRGYEDELESGNLEDVDDFIKVMMDEGIMDMFHDLDREIRKLYKEKDKLEDPDAVASVNDVIKSLKQRAVQMMEDEYFSDKKKPVFQERLREKEAKE